MKSKFAENFEAAMAERKLTKLETTHLEAIADGARIRAYARVGHSNRWTFTLEGGSLKGTVYLGTTMRALMSRGLVHAFDGGLCTLTKTGEKLT